MSERATIIQIGTVTEDDALSGWVFNCRGAAVAIGVTDDGETMFAGWRIGELRSIAEQQAASGAGDAGEGG